MAHIVSTNISFQSDYTLFMASSMPKAAPKALSTAANLANLLPTGTVLAFEALVPSFSHNGSCLASNRYLTLSMIVVFSVFCFIFSFTDSFIGVDGKLYYGIATTKGLYIFNKDEEDNDNNSDNNKEKDEEKGDDRVKDKNGKMDLPKQASEMERYKIGFKDYVHAFSSLLLFLVFAISSTDVQRCFFPHAGANENILMMNLPLGVGALVSFLFMLFPTKRRGIGFADPGVQSCKKCNSRT